MQGPDLQDRLIAEGYRIPIIFVTGYFDGRIRDRVLQAGAVAYFTKPWCEKTLSSCLEKALGVGTT
jgi:FixJ family two-component response regulator